MNLPAILKPHVDWPAWKRRALEVPVWKWAVGASIAGLLLIIVFNRRKVGDMIGGAWNWAQDEAFARALEAMGNPYGADILQVAHEENVSPLLIYGLGQNETRWGKGSGYKQNTGDWTMRAGHWVGGANTTTVVDAPPGWSYPKDRQGNTIPGPYAIPDDGLGWGRDLLQVDWDNFRQRPFQLGDSLAAIRAGVRIYRAYWDDLAGRLLVPGSAWTASDVDSAATAAYNHGVGGVMANVAAQRDVDVGTTGYVEGVEGSGYAARAESSIRSLVAQLT